MSVHFFELNHLMKVPFPAVGLAYVLVGFFHADSITLSHFRCQNDMVFLFDTEYRFL